MQYITRQRRERLLYGVEQLKKQYSNQVRSDGANI